MDHGQSLGDPPPQAWRIPSLYGYYLRHIQARAGLRYVHLHDLRLSYASRALALGESLPMIGKLLGHARIETTARYAHLARDSVREAAERVAESIGAEIMDEGQQRACGS